MRQNLIKAVVTGRVSIGTLWAVPEKSQRSQDYCDRRFTRNKTALDRNGIRRQGETGGGNAGRPIRCSLVAYESILWIGPEQKVSEGIALK